MYCNHEVIGQRKQARNMKSLAPTEAETGQRCLKKAKVGVCTGALANEGGAKPTSAPVPCVVSELHASCQRATVFRKHIPKSAPVQRAYDRLMQQRHDQLRQSQRPITEFQSFLDHSIKAKTFRFQVMDKDTEEFWRFYNSPAQIGAIVDEVLLDLKGAYAHEETACADVIVFADFQGQIKTCKKLFVSAQILLKVKEAMEAELFGHRQLLRPHPRSSSSISQEALQDPVSSSGELFAALQDQVSDSMGIIRID